MSVVFNRVHFSYSDGPEVLTSVSFEAGAGELLLVVGHNGAGKSSLLKLLNGINKPNAGGIRVCGLLTSEHQTATLAETVSVTFQNPADQIFASTVLKEAEYGPRNLRLRDSHGLALRALRTFSLADRAGLHPYDLSLAQRKLLTIASAVAMDTPVLAFDEPSVSLSQPERSVLANALGGLRQDSRTLLVVSHDLELFFPIATRILVLNGGRISFFGTRQEALDHTRELRKAGVRLPLSYRLRLHAGLPLFPAPKS